MCSSKRGELRCIWSNLMCLTETRNWINIACSCLKHRKLLKGRWRESWKSKNKIPSGNKDFHSSILFLLRYKSQDTEVSNSHEGNLRVLCSLTIVLNIVGKKPEIWNKELYNCKIYLYLQLVKYLKIERRHRIQPHNSDYLYSSWLLLIILWFELSMRQKNIYHLRSNGT